MLLFKYKCARSPIGFGVAFKKKKKKNKILCYFTLQRWNVKQPSCIPFYLCRLYGIFKQKQLPPFFFLIHALQCVKTIPPALYISLSLIYFFSIFGAHVFLKKVKHISDILCVLLLCYRTEINTKVEKKKKTSFRLICFH